MVLLQASHVQLGWKQVFLVTLPLPAPLPREVSQHLSASALQKLQKAERLGAHVPESGGKGSTVPQ